MLYEFKKPIYLPSGGFLYSPICYLKPITKELELYTQDKVFNSYFEYILCIIEKYVDLPTSIYKMLVFDIYYIWTYINVYDIKQETETTIIDYCKHCNHKNFIIVDFAEADYKFFNQYSMAPVNEFKINFKNVDIIFERRNVLHNFEFSQMYLNEFGLSTEFDAMKRIFYCLPQIKSIEYQNKVIDRNDYIMFFKNRNYEFIKFVYNNIIIRENDFGIKNIITYNCKSCEKLNVSNIYDNMQNCLITPTTIEVENKEKLMRYVLNASSLDTFTLKEFLSLPIRYNEAIDRVMRNLKIEGFGSLTHYVNPYQAPDV